MFRELIFALVLASMVGTLAGCATNEYAKSDYEQNRKVRFAIDPVNGKEVDKAKAVIGAKPDGEVLYFESENNFQAFTLK